MRKDFVKHGKSPCSTRTFDRRIQQLQKQEQVRCYQRAQSIVETVGRPHGLVPHNGVQLRVGDTGLHFPRSGQGTWVLDGGETVRLRCSPEQKRKQAKVNLCLTKNFSAAFKQCQIEVVDARANKTGESSASCCRRVEEQFSLKVGQINEQRINKYIRKFPDQIPMSPMSRGPQRHSVEPTILRAVANRIEIDQVRCVDARAKRDVVSSIQEAFELFGVPHRDKRWMWSKFREQHPRNCLLVKGLAGRDERRIRWVTHDNLLAWHERYECVGRRLLVTMCRFQLLCCWSAGLKKLWWELEWVCSERNILSSFLA